MTATATSTGTPTTADTVTVAACVTDDADSADTATKMSGSPSSRHRHHDYGLADECVDVAYDRDLAASSGSRSLRLVGLVEQTAPRDQGLNAASSSTCTPWSGSETTVNICRHRRGRAPLTRRHRIEELTSR